VSVIRLVYPILLESLGHPERKQLLCWARIRTAKAKFVEMGATAVAPFFLFCFVYNMHIP